MREIKFRAWHKGYPGMAPKMLYDKGSGDCLIWKRNGQPVIVMQSTGLKDSKGVEIYEGDIVAIDGGAEPIKTAVFFEDGCYCVKMLDKTCELKYYTDMPFCELEIIGNLYEQPELLPEPGKE